MKARKAGSFRLESQARDEAIEKVGASCSDLVRMANEIARKIAKKEGRVSSPQVWKVLWERAAHDDGLRRELEDSDPRWMGAVFHHRQWHRLGWEAAGSHKRPVSIWQLQPELNV